MDTDIQAPLREDIRLLGDLLGETLREQAGEPIFQQVEKVRSLAKAAYQEEHEDKWLSLIQVLAGLPNESLLAVTRAFSHFLNYANIAEQYHRDRRRRAYENDPAAEPHIGSIEELVPRLLSQGITEEQLFSTLNTLQVELVLTAHPTEVARRTLLRKYRDIYGILGNLDRGDLTPRERRGQLNRLKRRITAAWQTNEIRRDKPTPVDEARWGLATIETTLWQAVPDCIRELDNQLFEHTGKRLPPNAVPIRLASWMGGDRDGNPFVTANVTREVLLLARWQAADLILRDVYQLRQDLSMHVCNEALRARVGADEPEPYRALLRDIRQKLENTRAWAEAELEGKPHEGAIYLATETLLEPLELMYQSLVDCNLLEIAQGTLLNLIRCVQCFGLSLLKLDIRQDSGRHAAVIAAVCDYLGITNEAGAGYLEWTEAEKQRFLLKELASRRPLLPTHFSDDPEIIEVLDTFRLLATQPEESLGAYVISMARLPSDVLTVKLLQQECGCVHPQRIVPLFETLEDLQNAPETLHALLSVDVYKADIEGHQEVMIGYSDSAKGAGFFAAAWAQYQAQEGLLAVSQKHNVQLTFFHGRGGSVSRGGGPAHAALLSQPPGCLQGRVRVTEQGEVIQHKFGNVDVAIRSLQLYLSATMEATLAPPPKPLSEWREVMQQLAERSVQEYRHIVYELPKFIDYFKAVTPESELQKLPLGSRPAKRKKLDTIQSLRAIPWVFAWTQPRLMLPAWLGVGQALREQIEAGDLAQLQQMRQEWPYFRMLMDMQEMVLAKVDTHVFEYYQKRLLEDSSLEPLGADLLNRVAQTLKVVGETTGKAMLSELPVLQRAIQLRNPYLIPLHITQVELLRRLRDEAEEPGTDQERIPQLQQALMVSIAGIAAGLRNTG